MANILIRDLDAAVYARLKASAKAHGRSLQAELHDVLHRADVRSVAETRRISARWMKRLQGRTFTDSTDLIRADRDER